MSLYAAAGTQAAAAKTALTLVSTAAIRPRCVEFTLSNTGRPCKLCLPWEGRVLAATGAGTFTENGVVFDVAATIQEAIAAGLFHPNCRHTLVAYRPGVTLLRPTEWGPAQEQAYQDTQRLRALEAAQ